MLETLMSIALMLWIIPKLIAFAVIGLVIIGAIVCTVAIVIAERGK